MTGDSIPVPCGRCPNCVKRRVSQWSFRLMQEAKSKDTISAHFITLTYDTTNVPLTPCGFMDLSKRHLQLFFKRLRKSLPGRKVKYYAVGEYGGKSYRPHYHVILFNVDINKIQDAWGLGSVHYGTLSPASVGYTLKYLSKPSRVPLHVNDDRIREFALMSKGIGKNYLTKQMVKWHLASLQDRMYCNLEGGRKIAMPRYYKEKIYSKEQRKAAGYFTAVNMLMRKLEWEKKTPDHYRIQAEADKASFVRMHKQSMINLKI